MDPIRREEVYETALANALRYLTQIREKTVAWNDSEVKRVDEFCELMRGGAYGIDQYRQVILRIDRPIRTALSELKNIQQNRSGLPRDVATLELALDVAIEAIERLRAHEKKAVKYVEEMDRRIKLVNHKLAIQAVSIRAHGQTADNHFALVETALVVLNGQSMSMEHNARSVAVRRLRAHAKYISRVIEVGFFVIMGLILLGLLVYFL